MWKPDVYILKNVHILYMMWKEYVYTEYETNTVLYFLGELGSNSLSLSLSLSQASIAYMLHLLLSNF